MGGGIGERKVIGRGAVGSRGKDGSAIRRPDERERHQKVTIRKGKRADAMSADALFDSYPEKQAKIEAKAFRTAGRREKRRLIRAGVSSVRKLEKQRREEEENAPYRAGGQSHVSVFAEAGQFYWYKKRLQGGREKAAQRTRRSLIRREQRKEKLRKHAKRMQRLQAQVAYFRDKTEYNIRQAISNVQEAVKKKIARAKTNALQAVLSMAAPFLILLLLFVTVIIAVTGEAGIEEQQSQAAKKVIEYAVSWAEEIAADDSHGYNNAKNARWGPDYACSSFIIEAWEQAGVPVKTAGAGYTSHMKKYFLNYGFIDVTHQINLQTGEGMQRGDVFVNPGVHTEMAVSSTHLVGARGDANSGKPQNGRTGDQGGEISVVGFFPDDWKVVLRYIGNGDGNGSGLGYQIVSYAKGFVGHLPYIWGGTSLETGADCSGFTQAVFAQFGINIPRTAEEQAVNGKEVEGLSQAQAGDIIYYSGAETGHVGIYIGDGQIVHCANSRDGTKISTADYRPISAIRRYIADAATGNFSGSTNEEICWNFFISQGFSPAATAGILGNIYAESGFDPSIHQIGGGPGRGLAQWESSSGGSGRFDSLVEYANALGTSWDNLQTQLKFIMYELNSGKMTPFFSYVGGLSAFKASTSAAQAAYDWLVAYEYCGTGFSASDFNLSGRQAYAEDCLKRHGG